MVNYLRAWYADAPTLVFGHRGASRYAPMNTLPAFELAAAQGAAGVELDVRLTRDGQMVIIHDDTVDHTTDGSGHIQHMTFAEVRELDAGGWFGEQFKGTRIPTLDEVFEAVGSKLLINVEIKSEAPEDTGVEARIADAIARFGLRERVIVSSFDPLALWRFRKILPEVAIGYLHAEDIPAHVSSLMIGLAHEARHPHHTEINARYMDWARRNDYFVNTWTVNDPARAVELRDLGVHTLITDTPDVLIATLGQTAS